MFSECLLHNIWKYRKNRARRKNEIAEATITATKLNCRSSRKISDEISLSLTVRNASVLWEIIRPKTISKYTLTD